MNKEALAYVKGLFSALLVLTLGALLLVPLMSGILNSRTSAPEINVYLILLIVWILLAVTLGIVYLASEGSKQIRPVPLPIEEGE